MKTKTKKIGKRKPAGQRRALAGDAGSDPTSELHDAVVAWVKAKGGTAIVTSGPEVQHWPGDGKLTYRVAIRVTGRPVLSDPNAGGQP